MRRFLLTVAIAATLVVPGSAHADGQLAVGDQVSHLITQSEQPAEIHLPEIADAPVDPRAEEIERLLAHYHSPLQGLGPEFVAVADRDGYDWRLLVSIAGIESSFGRHQRGYNLFGWNGGATRFRSFSDAIDTVSKGLARKYISRGLTTPSRIQPVYCPPNRAWGSKVSHFMAQIG